MSYVFHGLLSRIAPNSTTPTSGTVRRNIDVTGLRQGIKFPGVIESISEILAIARASALTDAVCIHYQTWAGTVDSIEGFQIQDGSLIGGSEFYAEAPNAGHVFVRELREYGVEIADDGYFQPFERGYWDEL